jgi:hypothetical protein
VLEDVPAVSSEIGMERALLRIRADRAATQPARKTHSPSLLERARDFLASLVPQPILKPALAGALALVAVQAVVIFQMAGQTDDDSAQMRAIAPSRVVEQGPYLKVNFKGEARESEIRLLLVEVNGSLAAGPGQLGDYYVRVPAKQIAVVTEKLRTSNIVDAVAVVDGLPPRER